MAQFEIKWTAPEFPFREKGVSWYWISIIVAVIILGISIWQKNFLFGFFIVIAEILVLTWANREPQLVEFVINEKGLSIGENKFTAYTTMESFSVEANADKEWPDIFFQFHRRLRPILKIRVPHDRLTEIQKSLKAVLPQTEHETSFLDTLEELIGF
ncbi:MAG: hypothetical protein KGJ89_00720 [Patescibacteria group bacterium]|nr:hypothetical protein [Patescibacteria group bacterium]MDE2015037.1 hypothetical protein [Patescibacteria group bacterium]MDE2226465.1 hypothetical protein [Patescibacteria group bacterium]